MTDTPNKPENQASGQPQPDEEERPQLREVSRDELKRILEAHEKWLESDGKEGEKANLARTNLIRANLQGANLFRANLQGASLHGANLEGANLEGAQLTDANLQEADLFMADLREAKLASANLQEAGLFAANLQGANLRNANVQKAHLRETILRDADLSNADLTGTMDIVGDNFGGAKLTNAKLPDPIAKFEGLGHVEETSKNARKIFLAMLLGCAYAWLTIATTTDARLLTNSASSPLPIIGTEIPIAWFYWAAPFILVGLYVYLHFYLELLWEGLAGLPAIFPDGKRLDERAYPWLLNGLVRRHFKLLKEDRPLMAKLKELVTIFLAWWAVPATLLGFWVRYLPRHEWWGTWIHIGLMVVSAALAIIFYRSATRTLRGVKPQLFRWKTSWRDWRTYQSAGTVLVGFVLWGLSYGAIDGVRTRNPDFADVRTWVPRTFEWFDYSTFADLRQADVSTKPANYWQLPTEDRNKSVKGATLRGRDLRYADARRAFLANADLRGANLQGANLRNANLQVANLNGADLPEANLIRANLQGANLIRAKLQGAELTSANLQGADLKSAKLQGADLRFANLQGADLRNANLQVANLFRANLQGAMLGNADLRQADLRNSNLQGTDLYFAEFLTQEQLIFACGNAETKLHAGLSIKPCPEEGQ